MSDTTRLKRVVVRDSWRISSSSRTGNDQPSSTMWWLVSTNRCRSGAMRIKATRNADWSPMSQTAARSAAHTREICSSTLRPPPRSTIAPPRHRMSRDDLHRLVELVQESCRQVRMPGYHRVHCFAQPVGIKSAGYAEIKLQRERST